jgi:uncharacterized protein YbjT (DUF2867 family)
MKTVLIAGASGLIGSTAVQLAPSSGWERVVVLVRKKMPAAPQVEQWVATGDDLLSGLEPEQVDAVICCLGTTIHNVGGDKSKFIHVDKDLVLGLGRWAKTHGVPVFCVVSSLGADAGSRVFYNRVKGEMEQGLKAIGLPALHIFQPSILTGPRKEKRIGERIGIMVMSALAPLLPMKLKPMPHTTLAKALLTAAQGVVPAGTHQGARIRELAR